ncbi:MAG: HAMP domain-containing histidine kinase [Acidimicrobiia bacterium]|nr:HAMP domain-containing histidine kinase [Acidimicrobiia bacterium]
MRRRFFWGMVAVAVATLLVGGLTAAVLVSRSVEASARTEFARQAAATARLIEAELPPGAAGRILEGARLVQILREVALVGGHEFVEAAVVGPRGAVTVLGEKRVLIDQVPDLTGLTVAVSFDADVDGSSVTAVAQPFRLGERGTLVVVIGTSLELIPWRQVLLRFVWALGLALILAAVLAASLSRFAGRRVAALQAASQALAAGDLTARVPADGHDELTDMAVAFNEMAAQLEGARRREREFLVAVGHDLRTPLTTIAGYAEAMEEGRVPPGDLDRVAGVLGAESTRLQRLVEDLMLLSRIEAPEFTLRPEPVALAAHLRGVLEAFRARAETARVRLSDAIEEVGTVVLDPDRIAQVVGNLMENALRYTPEAGTVALALGRAEGGVVIAVTDSGPGIDPTDVPHVFERLYVATRYRPVRPEGSGLGLSIVRQLVTAMGGRAEVDSSPGTGTTIRVVLPTGTSLSGGAGARP